MPHRCHSLLTAVSASHATTRAREEDEDGEGPVVQQLATSGAKIEREHSGIKTWGESEGRVADIACGQHFTGNFSFLYNRAYKMSFCTPRRLHKAVAYGTVMCRVVLECVRITEAPWGTACDVT